MLSNKMQTVIVNLTRADLLRLSRHAMPRSRPNRFDFGLLAITIVGIMIAQHGLPRSTVEFFAMLLTTILFLLGAAILIFVLAQLCVFIYSRRSNGVLGEHVYTLRDDGLFESTKANETLTKWGGATALFNTGVCLYVQVSPGLFHVIPRRCFDSVEKYQTFWDGIQPLVPDSSRERARGSH